MRIGIQEGAAAEGLAELEIVEHVRIELLVLAIEERRQVLGIIGPEPEAHQRLRRSQHRLPGFVFKSIQELRRDRHARRKFARVGQQRRDDAGPEILRLVDDDVERTAIARDRARAP